MKISVAMTVYNGEQYLIEQLNSIRDQSLKVDEVIICDDGSTDNTINIIKDYIQENELEKNWQFIQNPTNLGYEQNFYKAMKLTTGDYVFFSDQDDIWLENKVKDMTEVMEKQSEIKVLGSEFEPYYCTEDAPIISEQILKRFTNSGIVEKIHLNHNTIFIGSEGCTMCVRKSFLNEIDQYWFKGWAQDEFVWKLSLCVEGCFILHRTTLKRRLHSNNVSKKKMHQLEKRIKFLTKLLQGHEAMYQYALFLKKDKHVLRLIDKNIKSVNLRIELLEKRKIINIIPLVLLYFNNYHSRKSIPMEFLMAVKG
jgi:glycosyltransferase involved in cell wall biosynthesis